MKATKVWAMARKETLHIVRDFRSLYLAVFIPIVLILLFGYALKLDVEEIKTAILDFDNSPDSRELISQLTASGYFVIETTARDSRHLQTLVDSSHCAVGLQIPPDFSRRMKSGGTSAVQAFVDGTNPNRASIVMSYLTAVFARYNNRLAAHWLSKSGLPQPVPSLDYRLRVWFNEELQSKNFIIPGLIGVIMMIVGALMTSLIIAREWERGTMETLLSVPIHPREIVVGKLIPYFVIGVFDLFLVIVLARTGFGIRMAGSIGLLLFSSSLFLYVALVLGILISTVAKSQLVANQMGIMLTFLPTFLLSGFIFPISNMPGPIQYITYLVPARYFISIVSGVYLRGVGIDHLWPALLALLAMALVLTLITIRKGHQRIA